MVFLSKIALVGCTIALLFSACTFVVLGFLKKGNWTLRLKQHFTFCFFFINIIILAGVRSYDQNHMSCKFTTIFLQYFVTVLHGWIATESYQLLSSVSVQRFQLSTIRVFLIAWGLPLPFILLAIVLELTVKHKLGSGFYDCWNFDGVIWTMVVPCSVLVIVSFACLFSCLLKVSGKTPDLEHKVDKEAVRYVVHTSIIQLLVLVVTWISAFSMFWYPKEEVYQIMFGVGNMVQGLLLFFFYCIFFFEENYHTQKHGTLDTFSEHAAGETNFELVENYGQENGLNVSEDENFVTDKEEIEKEGEKEEYDNKRVLEEEGLLRNWISTETKDQNPASDVDSTHTETTALVHTTEKSPAKDLEIKTKEELIGKPLVPHVAPEILSTIDSVDEIEASTTPEKAGSDSEQPPKVEMNNTEKASDDLGNAIDNMEKTLDELPENLDEPEKTVVDELQKTLTELENSIVDPEIPLDKNETGSGVSSITEGVSLKDTPIETNTLDNISEVPDSEKQESSTQNSRNVYYPKRQSTSSYASPRSSATKDRSSRTTSRSSNVSFNSQMGMNELESLFNNPDLLSQANWKNRSKNNSNNNITQSPSQRHRNSTSKTSESSNERKISNVTSYTEEKTKSPNKRIIKRESTNEFFDFS